MAAAILASSWTDWIFMSKSKRPEYYQHQEKSQAGRIISPYVRYSIMDAMIQGRKIGRAKRTNFRPEGMEVIELRKGQMKRSPKSCPY